MLWGALFTVRLMVKRVPPMGPTFLKNSFWQLKAVWLAKAACWIAEVAITLRSFFVAYVFSQCVVVGWCEEARAMN